MEISKGQFLAVVGLVILILWLASMPLYKYPLGTDPYYGFIIALITGWLVAGPVLIGAGVLLEIMKRRKVSHV